MANEDLIAELDAIANRDQFRKPRYTFDVNGAYIGESITDWMTEELPITLSRATLPATDISFLQNEKISDQSVESDDLTKRNLELLRNCAPNCTVTELPALENDGLDRKYTIEYQLAGHQVVAVLEDRKFLEKNFGEPDHKYFTLRHWFISNSEPENETYVDVLRLSPENTEVLLAAPLSYDKKSDQNYYWGRKGRIVISSINFDALASFGHEAGHAWHNELLPEMTDQHLPARTQKTIFMKSLLSMGEADIFSSKIGTAPHDNTDDYLLDFITMSHSERYASEFAIKLLTGSLSLLPQEAFEKYLRDRYESSWNTYDEIVVPYAGTSDESRTVPIETARVLWEYINWLTKSRNRVDELVRRITGEKSVSFTTDDAVVTITINNDILKIDKTGTIDPTESILMIFNLLFAGGYTKSPASTLFDCELFSRQHVIENGHELASPKFELLKQLVDETLFKLEDEQDTLAKQELAMLEQAMSVEFINQFDPKAKRLASLKLSTAEYRAFIRANPKLGSEASEPVKRLSITCTELARYLCIFFKQNTDEINFDVHTGEKILTSYDLLRAKCRAIAIDTNLFTADEIANVPPSQLFSSVFSLLKSDSNFSGS